MGCSTVPANQQREEPIPNAFGKQKESERQLKVCVVSAGAQRFGGLENYVRELNRCLAKENVEIHLFHPTHDRYEDSFKVGMGGGSVTNHPFFVRRGEQFSALFVMRFCSELKRLVRKEEFDLVHLHVSLAPYANWAAAVSKLQGVPTMCTLHIDMPWDQVLKEKRFVKAIYRKAMSLALLRATDMRTFVSDNVAKGYGKEGVVIGSGIDTGFFDPGKADGKKFKEELMLEGKKIVYYSSRMVPAKGQVDLVLVAEELKKKRDDFVILLCGPSGDRAYYEGLLKRIKESPAKDNLLVFEPTGIGRHSVRDAYAASDVYAFPTQREALGLVALEAMAMEKPVVSYAVGALPMLLANGRGAAVPKDDVNAMAGAIDFYLSNPEKAFDAGRKGREFVLREYSLESLTKRCLTLYKQLLNRDQDDSHEG